MAAVAAPQHGGMWQGRRTSYHMMHTSSTAMAHSSYETGSRSATAAAPSQSFPFDINMRAFPPAMNPPMPTHQPSYGFDTMMMSHYSVQPSYCASMAQSAPHTTAVSYQTAPAIALPHVPEAKNGVTIRHHSPVKMETGPHLQSSQQVKGTGMGSRLDSANSTDTENGVEFSTDVDTLMKAIQSKPGPQIGANPALTAKPFDVGYGMLPNPYQKPEEGRSNGKLKRKYACSIPGCNKTFYQKTHLEIHTRAHTGVKPFVCKEPSCGQRFSQLGNLRTHERRHTGERPYQCDICHKTFAQRGNVRAHQIVHQQIKPFTCLLDDCGKRFTQLGNLKSHQNKFHSATLRHLTRKFASIREGDPVSPEDQALWEYFSRLYRNSNKGIKGRGKDRRIATVSSLPTPPASAAMSPSASVTSSGSYAPSSAPPSVHSAPALHDRGSRDSSMGSDVGHRMTMQGQGSMHAMPHAMTLPHITGHHMDPNVGGDEPYGFDAPSAGFNSWVFPERKMF